jgi:hypothetical protein
MRTTDLSTLLSLAKSTEVSALDLSAACATARQQIRRASPPEALPPLFCELGTLTVRALHLVPHHGLGIMARDAQPIKFGDIRVQREWYAYEVTNGIEVDIIFPVLGKPGHRHDSQAIRDWTKHNMRLVKKNFSKYIDATLPLLEHHWEYAILLSLLQQLDRLAEAERDLDEVRRMLTVIDLPADARRRYRGAAGTLARRPR